MFETSIGVYKQRQLSRRMERLKVREEDIAEDFVRSSGPGGQNVNKNSTSVRLRHIPTGVEVRCERERSQLMNRYIARTILLEKIETLRHRLAQEKKSRLEKIRRQTRRKPKSLKLKILEDKRRHSQKKMLRVKVRDTEQA